MDADLNLNHSIEREAEKAKIALSRKTSTDVVVERTNDGHGLNLCRSCRILTLFSLRWCLSSLRFNVRVESSFSKAHYVVRKETTWQLVQRNEDADGSHEGDL